MSEADKQALFRSLQYYMKLEAERPHQALCFLLYEEITVEQLKRILHRVRKRVWNEQNSKKSLKNN
jgi:hypothetical protein